MLFSVLGLLTNDSSVHKGQIKTKVYHFKYQETVDLSILILTFNKLVGKLEMSRWGKRFLEGKMK